MKIDLSPDEFITVRRFAAYADPDQTEFDHDLLAQAGEPRPRTEYEEAAWFAWSWRLPESGPERRCWSRVEIWDHPFLGAHCYYVLEVPDNVLRWLIGQMDYWGNRQVFGDSGLHAYAWELADRLRCGRYEVHAPFYKEREKDHEEAR